MKRRRSESDKADKSSGGYSSDDGELMIDMSPRKTKRLKSNSKRIKKSKKHIENADSECELEKCLQTLKMNNHLEYTAVKNNLTVANVRNILKRVVSNEHVLAIVKLKESEEHDEEEEDNPLHKIPTLTRSKAKELQQKDLPVVWPLPVSPVQPASSEVAVLINQELTEDSSDEEYQPHDEENNSEDDKESASISDIDSLPKTPATPGNFHDTTLEEYTNWTNDGLFKIPQQSSTDEQNIAKRTRSKLCLSSTNIETIEKAFVPPDITSDMYDFDNIDGVWKDFLNEFTEPLPQNHDDDEDTDPEYNVQVDDIPVDKEELREDPEVKVSRRELSDLVAELFDMDSIIDNGICNDLTDEQHNAISSLDVHELTLVDESVLDQDKAENENEVTTEPIEVEQIEQVTGTNIIITPSQRLILSQQLRQHVQLSTQHFLQLYGHPELWALADTCKQNLIHLLSLADHNPNSMFMAHNLKEAIDLCENWQQRLSKDNDETKSIYEFITNEMNKARLHRISHNRYYCRFPSQMMDVACNSKVFIYPELLPKIPFRLDLSNGGFKEFSPSEEEVLAIELSLYYKYMEANPQLYKQSKKRSYRLPMVVELLEKYLHNGRSIQNLLSHIRNRNLKSAKDNPIKYYFKHKRPPPTTHILLPFDEDNILSPRMQPKEKLPQIWREHVMRPLITVKAREKPPCFIQNNSFIRSAIEKNYTIIVNNCGAETEDTTEKDVTQIEAVRSNVMKLTTPNTTINALQTNNTSTSAVPNLKPFVQKTNILPANNTTWDTVSPNLKTLAKTTNLFPTKNSPLPPAISNLTSLTSEASLPVLYTSKPTNSGFGFVNTSNLFFTNPISMPLVTFITPTKNIPLSVTPVHPANNEAIKTFNTLRQNCIGNNNYNKNSPSKNTSPRLSKNIYASTPSKSSPLKRKSFDNKKENFCECKCTCLNDVPVQGQKLLTEYFKPKRANVTKTTQMNYMTNSQRNAHKKGKFAFKVIWKFQLHVNEYFLNILNSLHLIYNVNYTQKCIKDTFIHLLVLEFFLSLYFPNMLPSMPSLMTPKKQDTGTENFERESLVQNETFAEYARTNLNGNFENHEKKPNIVACEESDDNGGGNVEDIRKTKIPNPKSFLAERRRQKSIKESKLVRELLTKEQDLDYDISYAQLYYEKVQDRLNTEDPEDLKKFHDIVQSITSGEDPSDVYRKLEILLLPKHPDLLEQFLTFLLPGQAAKIGKFMEHFLISNMDKFVQMINIYFFKQPAQIRKIYTALSELSDIPNVSMDDVKSSILPFLKGNPLLIEWFLQLFPHEKPPESDLNDFERLDLDKMDSSDMFDHVIVPEENDDPYGGDNCICKCHNLEDDKYRTRYLHCIPCGMKYIQGRVYVQTGKRLRPATVTFDDTMPMSVHVKRLSAKTKPYKRRAESSPSKVLLSPNKSSGSGSDEHRLDMSTDNENDSKRLPKKNSKLYKSIQNKCRNKKDYGLKECEALLKAGEVTIKSLDSPGEVNNVEEGMDNCNSSAPDSTESLPLASTEENSVPVSTSNNIQVNVCDSTEADIDINNDTKPSSNILQVIIPSDDLNVCLESDDKVSPGSVASSDVSMGSDSDVSVHSEKSDLVNSDSDTSSIDDTEDNSNDSDIVDDGPSKKSKDLVTENHFPEHESSDEEEVESTSDTGGESDVENEVISDSNCTVKDQNSVPDDETDSKMWTRDEDKIVLQTFQEQCNLDSTLLKICELLPHKNMLDVKNRFQVLLNLLKKISAQD